VCARYDGHAEWYDERHGTFDYQEETAFLRERLGGASPTSACIPVSSGRSSTV
jgi:hypothetical protein